MKTLQGGLATPHARQPFLRNGLLQCPCNARWRADLYGQVLPCAYSRYRQPMCSLIFRANQPTYMNPAPVTFPPRPLNGLRGFFICNNPMWFSYKY